MVEFRVLLPIWVIAWHQSAEQGKAGRNFQQTISGASISGFPVPSMQSKPAACTTHQPFRGARDRTARGGWAPAPHTGKPGTRDAPSSLAPQGFTSP